MDWLTQGAKYVPALQAAEAQYGIPSLLLCRIAYQESHFRDDIVDGGPNAENCIGLMQLNRRYYPNAGQDWSSDIIDAAQLLQQNYTRFGDWQLAVAAYDWGGGNVHAWKVDGADPAKLPTETLNYLTQVNADVPIKGQVLTT